MSGFYTCPFCNRMATLTVGDRRQEYTILRDTRISQSIGLSVNFFICPNPECHRFSLIVVLGNVTLDDGQWTISNAWKSWRLVPESFAQKFPDYVPEAIYQDYKEACAIRDLSPKASATLARRCLQGILRDFWNAKGPTLAEEIKSIKDKVDPATWRAIDAVRKVGNIGAHMEKDINVIVDVEPLEAQLLITLIETLIKDWYIARFERDAHLAALEQLAADKDSERKNGGS